MIGIILALGLGARGVLGLREPGAAAIYPAPVAPTQEIWLVDGYNVLCTGLLGGRDRHGWWRREHRAALLERLERFDEPAAEIWVVFDGPLDPPPPAGSAPRVRAVYAASADEWLTREVRDRAAEGPVALVTADRRLADRARHRGARIVAPRDLLGRCTG